MNAGRFVGRVGGLAVVLGVGAAISLGQGIAWADDTSQTGSSSGSSTSGSAPTGPDSTAASEAGSSGHPDDASVSASRITIGVRTAEKDTAVVSGGATAVGQSPPTTQTTQSDNRLAAAQTGADFSDDPASASTTTPGDSTAPSDEVPQSTSGADGDDNGLIESSPVLTASDTNSAGSSRGSDHAPSYDPVDQTASPDPVADITLASPTLDRATSVAAARRPALGGAGEPTTTVAEIASDPALSLHVDAAALSSQEAAAPLSAVSDRGQPVMLSAASGSVTLKTIVTDVLTWIGLGALSPYVPVPELPMPSLIESLWLAVRNFLGADDTTVAIAGSAWGSPVLSADGTRALITTYAVASTTTRVAVIDTATGAQIGATLSMPGEPALPVVSADGSRALIMTRGFDTNGTATRVAVIDTTTATPIGNTLTFTGVSSALLSGDGTRALITTSPQVWEPAGTTSVAVFDTATGAQIGHGFTLQGNAMESPVLSPDGKHALITASDGQSTHVAVVDATTGEQTGTTFTLPGHYPSNSVPLSADAGRALVTTRIYDSATGNESTGMAVIDTVTGTQTGETLSIEGGGYAQVSADADRAVLTTLEGDSNTNSFTTRVAVMDTLTGTQTGSTLTLVGEASSLLSADGKRVLITTTGRDGGTNIDGARVAVIDTISGMLTFDPITFTGETSFGSLLVDEHGSRALIVTDVYDGRVSINSTRLSVIDTTTGNQIGTTTALNGFLNGSPVFSASSNRAVITTISSNFVTTGVPTTEVAVIDTITGTQVGSTLTLTPDIGFPVVSPDGTLALINMGGQMVVVDTATGAQTGTLPGGRSALFSPDGTRALIVSEVYDWFTRTTSTRVSGMRIS